MVKVQSEHKFGGDAGSPRHEIAVIEIEKTLCQSGA
jgi:hypothetical protein